MKKIVKKRVGLGAAWLDLKQEDWYLHINTKHLFRNNCNVLDQLFSSEDIKNSDSEWEDLCESVGLDYNKAWELGFDLDPVESIDGSYVKYWKLMDKRWKKEITKRLMNDFETKLIESGDFDKYKDLFGVISKQF